MDLSDFEKLRRDVALRIDDSVHAERTVVRLFVEIAAICKNAHRLAIGSDAVRLLPDRLVDPVPDAAAHKRLVVVDDIPVLLEVSKRVAHRMRVFAHEERLACGIRGLGTAVFVLHRLAVRRSVAELALLVHPVDVGIHARVDVRKRVAALPVD